VKERERDWHANAESQMATNEKGAVEYTDKTVSKRRDTKRGRKKEQGRKKERARRKRV
jgi:hypothetical protein